MVLALFGPQLRSAVATIWELGDVFAGVSNGNYLVYSSSGVSKGSINNGTSGYTTGCAFNTPTTQLYTTDFSGGRIVKFADADPHNSSSFTTTGQTSPESFAFKKDGGYFVGGPRGAVILEYDAADNLITSYSVAATDYTGGTDWIDLAINQTTIFYTGEGRVIKRYDTVLGQLSDFATLPGSGNAYAFRLLPPFDGSGGLIVADSYNVKRLDGSGNVIQTYSVTDVSDFFALNLDPDGTTFWTGSITSGVLYRFNIATGGSDNYIQTISTSTGLLYGVCLKGEITGGNPQQIDVNGAFVNKNETFVQTSTANPTPENGAPFQLVVGVDATAPNNITSANFTPPGGSATALTSNDGVEFNFFSTNFGDLTSFNAAFPNGDYAFDIHTAHAPSLLTPIITLAGDAYPDMPKILNTNWSGNALHIDHPDQPFTFEWSLFCASCSARPTGAPDLKWSGPVTDTSYITLRIADTSDNVVLEQSFSSLITSFPMPANTLQPGALYHAQLQFANLEDRNENAAQLSGQYATVTKFDIVSGTLAPPPVCFNGHTYMLTVIPENWTDAEAEAISKGGHLVAINNVAEQNLLVNHFLTNNFLLQPLWIGLSDRRQEGKFVWTTIVGTGRRATNAPLTYSNWNRSTHEPNDCCNTKIKHEEDYVAMNWHYARNLTDPIGSWNDVPNGGTLLDGNAHGPYFGIIEIPNCAQ